MREKFAEKEYVNRIALWGHTVIDTILFLAYLVEVFKGSRTLGYFAVFALLCIAPVIAEHIFYHRNPDSDLIKHVIGTSYGILYTFVIFTTTSSLSCVYAFPMFMVVILYMDVKFCALIGGGALLGNVAYVIYYHLTVGYTKADVTDIEIRMAAMLLTPVFMTIAARAVSHVNQEKMRVIEEQSRAAGELTEHVLGTSGQMISGIDQVSGKMVQLGESMGQIHDYMGEVSSGSNETAESIQLQLQKTEQIQQHIIRVKDTAAGIEENMNDTVLKVGTGKEHMDALAKQVGMSMEANRQVLDQMKTLSEYTNQMNTIIETITSIANSTGMLALNASIEAARAGEAGRGFAVVAGQISGLANQTKSATVNITELIGHINSELASVETAVDVVTESNRANAESTQVVTENFAGITQGTEKIGKQTKVLMDIVGELETANADIVESIQTISTITEEVSAHANETYNACEENSFLVDTMAKVVEELSDGARKLQNKQ